MKFRFLSKLPRNEIIAIDDQIAKEVVPFVKQMSTLPQDIQTRAHYAASTLNPIAFLSELRQAWAEHNKIAYTIDRFLVSGYSFATGDFPRDRLMEAERLLRSALEVERRKRIMSVAVKPALEAYSAWARHRYSLSDDEIRMVLTPPILNFWCAYELKHLRLIDLEKKRRRQCAEIRKKLAETFHAEEALLLECRLQKQFSNYLTGDKHLTRNALEALENIGKSIEKRRIASFYLLLERPELRAIQDIVAEDNFYEYLWASNLFGIPDLYFRRFLIAFMVRAGVVPQRQGILFYSESELLDGIAAIILEK